MNTIYFKYAVEVENAGSITQAAQNLYMAQPNLSKAIKDLEDEIGYAIFKRTPGGIKVTDKGEEFLYHARKLLEQLEEMERLSEKSLPAESRFKISIPRGSYIAGGVSEFVASLPKDTLPDITINETNAAKTISNVTDYGYNLGIIRYKKSDEEYFNACLKNNNLTGEVLWEFEYLVVMSKVHPLADKAVIHKEDLADYIKITHGDIDMPQGRSAYSINSGAKSGRIIYVYERGSQFDLLANVPSSYMWVSPIPKSYLDKYGLVQRACRVENNYYKDVLIYRNNYSLNDTDKLFQKKIYESKIEVASAKYT